MGFYFCEKYINTEADEKKVERNIYAALSYFLGSNDFFRYFSLTPAQKCQYAQLKLTKEAYWWWENSHIDCRDWLIL